MPFWPNDEMGNVCFIACPTSSSCVFMSPVTCHFSLDTLLKPPCRALIHPSNCWLACVLEGATCLNWKGREGKEGSMEGLQAPSGKGNSLSPLKLHVGFLNLSLCGHFHCSLNDKFLQKDLGVGRLERCWLWEFLCQLMSLSVSS